VGAFVLRDEEQAFEEHAASVARENRVHLVTGVAVFMPGEGYYENLLIAFDSTGTRLARYHKARPVPGDPERGADPAIPVTNTVFGRLAGAVCFDADFPVSSAAPASRVRNCW
jgi:apolipoprotein N-acyltransferase